MSMVPIAIRKPWPTSPSSASSSTATPSSVVSPVTWPRIPMNAVRSKVRPSVASTPGTRNTLTPWESSGWGRLRATTRWTSATPALVPNAFSPVIS